MYIQAAVCELFDHHDGTFTLSVKPAEAGRHVLNIQFGGEHVPGGFVANSYAFNNSM
jgi:filamin